MQHVNHINRKGKSRIGRKRASGEEKTRPEIKRNPNSKTERKFNPGKDKHKQKEEEINAAKFRYSIIY